MSIKDLINTSKMLEASKEFDKEKRGTVWAGVVQIGVEAGTAPAFGEKIAEGEDEWFKTQKAEDLVDMREVRFTGEKRFTRKADKIREKLSAGLPVAESRWKRNRLPGAWLKACSEVGTALTKGIPLTEGMSAKDLQDALKEHRMESTAPSGAADRSNSARAIDAADKLSRYARRLNQEDLDRVREIIREQYSIDIV